MNKKKNIILGLSVGDLNGIGLEIILSIFEDKRMFDFCIPVIFGSQKSVEFVKNHFKLNTSLNFSKDINQLAINKLNVVSSYKDDFNIQFGNEDKRIGEVAVESFVKATDALKDNLIDVLVTAPINKHNIQSEKFSFPGHTDYLNQELSGESLMLLINDNLRVGLLTDHVAVKDVSKKITPDLIKSKVNTVIDTLKKDFRISKPKIALLGLNPHVGDNGVIGEEDDEVLKPTLQNLKKG